MQRMINKKMVNKVIHNQQSERGPIPVSSDIMSKIDIGCRIEAGYEEAYYGSDSAHEAHYYFRIIREREETDAEYDKRIKETAKQKEELKKRRYETYLKLKQEFKNEEDSN